MNKIAPIAAAGFLAFSSLQSATLIEYDFDSQLNSTSYADLSGNSRTLTFNRNVTTSTAYPFSVADPELAGIDLSAQTKYNASTSASVSNIAGINLNTTKTFTMEGWVNLAGFASISGTPTGGTLWSVASTTGGTSAFALRYTSAGLVQATFNALSQSGGTRIFDTSITLSLNTWTHLAYVKTATSVLVYVNGVLVSTFQETGITSRNLPTALDSITVALNIFGNFDDFRFSDTALSASELGYNAPFTPIPEPSTTVLLMLAAGAAALGRRKKIRE